MHVDVFAGCDLVIEAVFEEMDVKKEVFAELERVVSPECVIATNTSSLSVTEISTASSVCVASSSTGGTSTSNFGNSIAAAPSS